jgi:hypothetical protein
MRFSQIIFATSLIATICVNTGGCAGQRTQPQAIARTSTLEIVTISPDSNSSVTRGTVVFADLKYSVGEFIPGKYLITAQVQTTKEGRTFDGTFPSRLYPSMISAEGTLRFSFPLEYVWDSPKLKHPMTLWFYLHRREDDSHTKVVARTGPIFYEP